MFLVFFGFFQGRQGARERGSAGVRDRWSDRGREEWREGGMEASKSVARRLGYNAAPPVVHEHNWRDPDTGFHTNDVESENARLKLWLRSRYGKLRPCFTSCAAAAEDDLFDEKVELLDMYEYVFYTNRGSGMCDTLCSIGRLHGGTPNATFNTF